MRKLNKKKLNRIYDAISNYDTKNSGLVFDISSLMKYCIEYDLKEVLKGNIGNVDEPLMAKIFESLNFNVKINYVGDRRGPKRLIKYNLEYSDPNTFMENYTSLNQ